MCMEDLKSAINKNNLPVHIAVIMDCNGRWAQNKTKNVFSVINTAFPQ